MTRSKHQLSLRLIHTDAILYKPLAALIILCGYLPDCKKNEHLSLSCAIFNLRLT